MLESLLAFAGGAALRELTERLFLRPRASAGLDDQLLWTFPVAPGVLFNADGSFTAAWSFRGPDHSSTPHEDLAVLLRTVHTALSPLTGNWLIQLDALRIPAHAYATDREFPDPVALHFDQRREGAFLERGTTYVTRQVLILTSRPPAARLETLGAYFVEDPTPAQDAPAPSTHLETFGHAIEAAIGRLGRELRLEPLSTDALAQHLRTCLTGRFLPLRLPSSQPQDLTRLLLAEDLCGGFKPSLGPHHIRAISVAGYPDDPPAIEWFHSLGFELRSNHRVLLLDPAAARAQIGKKRQLWYRFAQGIKRQDEVFRDGHAAGMAQDGREAMDLATGGEPFGFYNWTLVLTDQDSTIADDKASELLRLLERQGVVAHLETLNALPAYLGSLPSHGGHNLRRPLLALKNVAALLPLTTPWRGHATNPSSLFPPGSSPLAYTLSSAASEAEGTSPYRLNHNHGDIPHSLVLGRTRSGKSVLISFLAAQALRWPGSQVFLFDLGYSAAFLAHALGGQHHDLASPDAAAPIRFQPLANLEEDSDRQWALHWVEALLELHGVDITPAITAALTGALDLLAADPLEARTLSLFRTYVQHQDVRRVLQTYTSDGPYGSLFDSAVDAVLEGRFQVFELEHIMGATSHDKLTIPLLLYLFRRIETRLRDNHPALIIIEEAWRSLLHPLFERRIEAWLRTLGKLNAGVVLVTQSLEELRDSPRARLMFDSCPTRFVLPDPSAQQEDSAALYKRLLGLNPREIELLAGATPRHQYLHTSPEGTALFHLDLTDPFSQALLLPPQGVSVLQRYRAARDYRQRHGALWFANYLEDQGLSEEAVRLRETADGF